MPWYIEERDGKSCVIKGKKGESGKQVKCHDLHEKAVAHMRALYHSESGKPFTKSDAELIAAMESDTLTDAVDEVRKAVLYYLRSREDGKTDVIEGDIEAAGRVVSTFDTFEEAHRHIIELHQALQAPGMETLQQIESDGTIVATWPLNPVPRLSVRTAEISSDDGEAVLDGFVVVVSTNENDEGFPSLTSSAPIAGQSYLRVADTVMKFGVTSVKGNEILNLAESRIGIDESKGRTNPSRTFAHNTNPFTNDSSITPVVIPSEMDSPVSGGRISKPSLSDNETDAPSASAESSSLQVQVRGRMPTSTIVIPLTKSEDGSAEFAIGDSEPSTMTLNSWDEPSSTSSNLGSPSKKDHEETSQVGLLAVGNLLPPPKFFQNPKFDKLQRYVTITSDGRFMTHLASWDTCHVGYGDVCITAPKEKDYNEFAVGTVLTSEGSLVPTGVIALTGGHADIGLDASSARSHYDNPATAVADVVVGTDDFGIWISGVLRPGVTEEQVRALRASGVSGDWRLIDNELRLIGICCVNVPGFPKLSVAASADTIDVLIAAGGAPEPHPDLCACKDSTQDIIDELDGLQRLVADAGLEDVALSKLAERIPPNDAELDGLYARVT